MQSAGCRTSFFGYTLFTSAPCLLYPDAFAFAFAAQPVLTFRGEMEQTVTNAKGEKVAYRTLDRKKVFVAAGRQCRARACPHGGA